MRAARLWKNGRVLLRWRRTKPSPFFSIWRGTHRTALQGTLRAADGDSTNWRLPTGVYKHLMPAETTTDTSWVSGNLQDRKKLRVFVSYSRRDQHFIPRLESALAPLNIDILHDKKEILPLEQWMARLEKVIVTADTVIFVISSNSIQSDVCRWEAEYAAKLHKRIAPIVIEQVDASRVPAQVSKFQFISFLADRPFAESAAQLVSALGTDIDWVRQQTEIGELAVSWQSSNRAARRLLKGKDISAAEHWRDSRPTSAPELTQLQQEFIHSSRRTARFRGQLAAIAFALFGALAGATGYLRFQTDELKAGENVSMAIRTINDLKGSAEKRSDGYHVIVPSEVSNLNQFVQSLRILAPVVELNVANSGITDENVTFIGTLGDLKALDISHNEVTDRGLAALSTLRKLRSLDLSFTRATDRTLPYLSDATDLAELDISSTDITGSGLAELNRAVSLRKFTADRSLFEVENLRRIPNKDKLHYLSLENLQISDSNVALFAEFAQLTYLDLESAPLKGGTLSKLNGLRLNFLSLSYTDLDDQGFRQLGTLKDVRDVALKGASIDDRLFAYLCDLDLEVIRIPDSNVGDAGFLACRGKFSNVREIYIGGTKITTAGLQAIAPFEKVEVIYFPYTRIGDDGIELLSKMPKLRKIWPLKSSMTRAGLARLRSLRPDIEIKRNDDPDVY
jgi:Leucine-rich repeat (LRR) protein